MSETVYHKLDLRGAIIPFSLLKVSQVFKIALPGEIIEVLCNDPGTQADLFKILPATSYELVMSEEMKEEATYRTAFKKKSSGPVR